MRSAAASSANRPRARHEADVRAFLLEAAPQEQQPAFEVVFHSGRFSDLSSRSSRLVNSPRPVVRVALVERWIADGLQ